MNITIQRVRGDYFGLLIDLPNGFKLKQIKLTMVANKQTISTPDIFHKQMQ